METINELKLMEQIVSSLPTLWRQKPELDKHGNEISVYTGSLTDQCLVRCVATIQKAFPALPLGFYDVLVDRIRLNKFNDDRLIDAVGYVIDNCPYPTPAISNFISYDKRIKVLNYEQYLKVCDEGLAASYKPIKFKDRPAHVWIHVNDIAQYKIVSE